MTGAGNQQERAFIEAIPTTVGSFLSGFALGEASFMVVVRRRADYDRKWKISAAFNVSQQDRAPLDLFMETLDCGSMRKAGNGGWYWEVNDLSRITSRIVPFFRRFPLVGRKQENFERFAAASELLSKGPITDSDYASILALREGMNNGGKRRYSMEEILRDYTPSSPA